MTTACSETLVLAAVKIISPVPDAPSPTLVLLFTQLNAAPAVPLSGILTVVPLQGVWLGTGLTDGIVLTVMMKFLGWDTQVPVVAVTVTLEVMAVEPLF